MRVHISMRIRTLLPLAALALAAACSNSDGPEQVARVRFLHASQGRAAIDFLADGTTRGPAITYSANWSASGVVKAGSRILTARLTGSTADLGSTTAVLANSATYSIALAKRPAKDSLIVYADTLATPAVDKSWVRILNLSPAAGTVDVYVTAANADLATVTPLAIGVAFLKPSKYVEVGSGALRVRLTTTGTKTVLLDINTLALPSKGVRSIAVLDATAGGTPLQSVTGVEQN